MSTEIQHVWARAGSCSASPATSYLLIFPSFTSSRSVSLLHRNTIWVILQDTRQVVIVSLEGSLSLPKLFFPLWDTQLKDYIVKVRCNSLNSLVISEINHSKDIFPCLSYNKTKNGTLTTFLGAAFCIEEIPCLLRYCSIFSSSMESTGTLRHSLWNAVFQIKSNDNHQTQYIRKNNLHELLFRYVVCR